jgi:hypothetical protein
MSTPGEEARRYTLDGSYTFDPDKVMTGFEAEATASKLMHQQLDCLVPTPMTQADSLFQATVKKSTKCETCGSRVILIQIAMVPGSMRVSTKAFYEFKRWGTGGIKTTEHTPMRCRSIKNGDEEPWE